MLSSTQQVDRRQEQIYARHALCSSQVTTNELLYEPDAVVAVVVDVGVEVVEVAGVVVVVVVEVEVEVEVDVGAAVVDVPVLQDQQEADLRERVCERLT